MLYTCTEDVIKTNTFTCAVATLGALAGKNELLDQTEFLHIIANLLECVHLRHDRFLLFFVV